MKLRKRILLKHLEKSVKIMTEKKDKAQKELDKLLENGPVTIDSIGYIVDKQIDIIRLEERIRHSKFEIWKISKDIK